MKLKHLLLSSILLLFFSINSALAQNSVSGKVTDENGEAIIGATILKKGTFSGTSTDVNGDYTLSFIEPSITLIFSYVGYTSIEKEVNSSTKKLDIKMTSKATSLDEVVVSGVATSVKRSNAANSVDYIPAREISEITSQATMDGALYGKFKGAEIRSSSGAPGGGMSIRLRGISTILGSKQPIYIVDGIFVDNSTTPFGNDIVSAAAGGGSTASNQDDATNRIADLDPDDIETIEILKGSSAAAIYGSKAANGVVIITTKNGKAGKPQIKYSQTLGFIQAIRLLGIRDLDRAQINTSFGASAAEEFDRNGLYDYENELFGGKGLLTTSRLSASGGTDKTTFYIGGAAKRGDGIVDNTGYKRYSLRTNVSHKINNKIKIRMTNNFIRSTTSRGFFNNGNNNTNVGYALAFTQPWEDLHADENGNYPSGGAGSNVLETVDLVRNEESIFRYMGGLNLTTDLIQQDNQVLKLILFGGLDHYGLRTKSIFPKELTYFQEGGGLSGVGGVSIGGNAFNTNTNTAAFLVHNYYGSKGTSFRTQFGVTQEAVDYELIRGSASNLNGSQTNIQQSSVQNISHFIRKHVDQGFFVQEEINFSDKIIGTIGVRGDKSTRNGDIDQYFFYPKANLAINLTNLGIIPEESIINALKLRVAYGEAGTFAPFGSKFTTLNSTVIDGSSGLISSATRGNPTISPQRNKELEFGFDLGLMENRLFLDVTFYNRKTIDFLLPASMPASSGFTSQISNAGDIQNSGVEIGLDYSAVEKQNLKWNTGFKFWKNKSLVTRLIVPNTPTGGFANSLGTYLIQEGESLTQIVGSYNPADCDNCDPDNDGLIKYGDAEADFNLSWMNRVEYKNFELSFLFHWKKGGHGINLSTLLYDLAGMTWDYDDHTLDPTGVLSNADYRINNFFAGSPIGFIEDNSYIRLREIGLYYNFQGLDRVKGLNGLKIGVSGKNLINIFEYNSYDPEVSNFGNNAVANAIEVTPYPSTKQMAFHLIATF